MKNWLKENWLFALIFVVVLFLAFGIPFLYKYPTKEEYESWKKNAINQEIEDYIYESKEEGEFYAP